TPEDLLQEEEEPPAGEVEGPVGLEVEDEAAARRLAEFEEDRVPDEAPGPRRGRVGRQAVAQESEGDAPVLAADGVVEKVGEVGHRGEPRDRLAEERVVLPPSPGHRPGPGDDAELG